MAKRKQDSGASVNLFPFLSILVSIIGCLTLIIVVINLIAMAKTEGLTPEEVERAREFVVVEREKDEAQKEIDRMRQLIEHLIQQNRDILTAKEKLITLKEMLDNQEEIDKSRDELIAQFNILRQTNTQLVADEKNLQEEIVKKEEEVARRNLPPEPAALRVRPSGSATSVRPYFAEISEAGVYLHRSLSEEPVFIPVASLNQSPEFITLLQDIAAARNHRLIFLVRGTPGAVGTLNRAAGLVSDYNRANGSEIIPGRLPLPGEGKVDLQMFAQYLAP